MDRATPVAHNEEIELYIRTYYSLLRSSGPIRVRSLEETHAAMNSSLHQQADSAELDISALVYCAMRLPIVIPQTSLLIMGQMDEVFVRAGYRINRWQPVKARARRRKFYYNEEKRLLASFVASVSDIDDIIPCLTTFQIEWNKIHQKLMTAGMDQALAQRVDGDGYLPVTLLEEIRAALGLTAEDFAKLSEIWPGRQLMDNLRAAAGGRLDLRIRVLGSGLSDYRRSVQCWWKRIEDKSSPLRLADHPVYFVSSNVHSMVNLISGVVRGAQDEILEYVQRENPENLWHEYRELATDDPAGLANYLYYTSGLYFRHSSCPKKTLEQVGQREKKSGVRRINDPHCLDVEAHVVELRSLRAKRVDPRLAFLTAEEWSLLRESDALVFNIDYPLGMAAYHIFSQVSTAVGRILGVYILGKAASLNGRVGDVMIPNVVYDEHSRNSYLFRNCFTAEDVAQFITYGTVFDNQKAVTVRGTILQNRDFIHVFYEEGYTDIEMEAGPYLSGIYEDIYPKRYPDNEIVNLFINAPYDIGLLHYASDTPISRRQMLLSKSLSYFGVDATYATSVAVWRRILAQELARLRAAKRNAETPTVIEDDADPARTATTPSPLRR